MLTVNIYALWSEVNLTLLLLNTTCPVLANIVDPDQLASELDLHCLSLKIWISIKNPDQVIWLAGNYKWAWHLHLFSMTKVNTKLVHTSFGFSLIFRYIFPLSVSISLSSCLSLSLSLSVCLCLSLLLWKKIVLTPLHSIWITVFDLITAHTPIRAQSSNSIVFSLQPVYFLSNSLKRHMLWPCGCPFELHRLFNAIQMNTHNICFHKENLKKEHKT